MEVLYQETSELVKRAQSLFSNLSQRSDDNTDEVESAIKQLLNNISQNCDRLDILVFKTPITEKHIAKMRCDQLKYDNKHMQAALSNFQERRYRLKREQEEREQLLSRRFTQNGAPQHTAIDVNPSISHFNSLQNANRGIDDMLMSGSNILSSIRNQGENLKGFQTRILNVANTLGLSNATISLIEKRARQDKYLLVAGMFITLLIILIVVMFFT